VNTTSASSVTHSWSRSDSNWRRCS